VNNVYVLRVPPNTGTPAFQAQWRIRMSDGRVLTPQQLQANLGFPSQAAADRSPLAGGG
jgi:hypothetical protein